MRMVPFAPTQRALLSWTLIALLTVLLELAYWQALISNDAFQQGSRFLLLGVCVIMAADALLCLIQTKLTLTRECPANVSLGVPFQLVVSASHPYAHAIKLRFRDPLPEQLYGEQAEYQLSVAANQTSGTKIELTACKRGLVILNPIEVMISSRLGFWQRQTQVELAQSFKVYPNFATIEAMKQVALEQQNIQLGLHIQPRRGLGTEFHQLRDYRQGDSLRQVDWKATARRQKLISREYQEERDQQVILMLDSGRRMKTQLGHISHFDHCLNALLMLAYTVIKQGDRVGMLTFAQQPQWNSALHGRTTISSLLQNVYAIEPELSATDYEQAAQAVLDQCNKRSLIILSTNIRDDDQAELLAAAMLLKRKHIVIVANLRENELDTITDQPVESFEDALSYSGIIHYQQSRQQLLKTLQKAGITVLDCKANELLNRLTNVYLAMKRAGRL